MTARTRGPRRGRPFIGVYFRCCNVYLRVFLNAERSAYEGRCPYCLRKVRAVVGPDGTTQRFFEAV